MKTSMRGRSRGGAATDWLFRPRTEHTEERTLLATMLWGPRSRPTGMSPPTG